MVVETSALLAMFWREPERELFLERVRDAPVSRISTGSVLEAYVRVLGTKGQEDADDLLIFVETLALEIVPFDEAQLQHARLAYLAYGKGRSPAKLNFGDCISYGLAMSLGEPLLFKGNDFPLTDVMQA